MCKAFDDRYGVFMLLTLLEDFKDVALPYDLYVAGLVQEEVGCRGASVIASEVKPDFALVFDASPAKDHLDCGIMATGEIGKGVLVRFKDGTMITPESLIDFQIDMCDEASIPHQMFYSLGGTDASIIIKSLEGIPSFVLGICMRNIHTPNSIFDVNDLAAAYSLASKILQDLRADSMPSSLGCGCDE
jgi:glutamyl aminopeptidase